MATYDLTTGSLVKQFAGIDAGEISDAEISQYITDISDWVPCRNSDFENF